MKKWILTLMLITLPIRLLAHKAPYEAWMGTFVGEAKIGYLTYRIDATDKDGVKGYKISSIMSNRLTVLGADITQLITTTVYIDETGNPLTEQFEMSSGGKTTSVAAEFKKDAVECVLSTGEGKSPKSIPIPPGAKLVGDSVFGIADSSQKIGTEYTVQWFNPLTLGIDDLKVKIQRREKITVEGKEYDTLVVSNASAMGDVTVWQDDSGDVIKVVAMAGITMIRQDRDRAVSGLNGSNEDFAVLTSVKADKAIPNPRQAKALDVVLDGVNDPSMIIKDSRQSTRAVAGKDESVRYHISAATFDESKSVSLPVTQADMQEYLGASPYLDYDLGGVREKAREVVGDETNAYSACSKIRAWLHENMRTRADMGISRPASDVLKSREGVCRDYAMLFVAMARAVGVPSRIAAGLTYTQGAFYYHAWVECWVGEWVPFDGTLPTDFVDATHIKLAEGGATSMFGLARVIGGLKAEVKAFK